MKQLFNTLKWLLVGTSVQEALVAAAPQLFDPALVVSKAEAEQLFAAGRLAKVHLMPEAFGGDASPLNLVYVPPHVVHEKRLIDETVAKLVAQGSATTYSAEPLYKGDSVVPCTIKVRAWHPHKTGDFESTLEVW